MENLKNSSEIIIFQNNTGRNKVISVAEVISRPKGYINVALNIGNLYRSIPIFPKNITVLN